METEIYKKNFEMTQSIHNPPLTVKSGVYCPGAIRFFVADLGAMFEGAIYETFCCMGVI